MAESGGRSPWRQVLALEPDVLVLSLAMFAFSLGFQMTGRYIPEYLSVLGATSIVIGFYGTVGNLISALYPYPGGALSDRIGSRYALTLFGALATAGFGIWWLAPTLGEPTIAGVTIPAWGLIFIGLFMAQAWKSFGLGATFAVVKQSVEPQSLATAFASTETLRRIGFLIGPLIATILLARERGFAVGFRDVLLVAVLAGFLGTVLQHFLYDASADTLGKSFAGIASIREDFRRLPAELRPLLIGDTLVRFANGMVYVFFVIVVVQFLSVGFELNPWLPIPIAGWAGAITLRPDAFFGILLAIEMAIALVSMLPMGKLADGLGLKPVVALGFIVYAVFPLLLINAPANQWVLIALFAFSGLRFAGLPAHKALIVGPVERDSGGRVTGVYYLLRNTIVIPSAAIGGWLYTIDPGLAFSIASVIGLIGVGYFVIFGRTFEPESGAI